MTKPSRTCNGQHRRPKRLTHWIPTQAGTSPSACGWLAAPALGCPSGAIAKPAPSRQRSAGPPRWQRRGRDHRLAGRLRTHLAHPTTRRATPVLCRNGGFTHDLLASSAVAAHRAAARRTAADLAQRRDAKQGPSSPAKPRLDLQCLRRAPAGPHGDRPSLRPQLWTRRTDRPSPPCGNTARLLIDHTMPRRRKRKTGSPV